MLGLILLLAMGFVFYTLFLAFAAWLILRDNRALHLTGRFLAIIFFLMAASGTVRACTSTYGEGFDWFVYALLLLNILFTYQFGILAWRLRV